MINRNTLSTDVFQAHIADEVPAGAALTYFFPRDRRAGDGMCLRVETGSLSWTGIFKFGETSFSGLYEHPNPQKMCVISRGAFYIVDVSNCAAYDTLTEFAHGCAVDEHRNQLVVHAYGRMYCVQSSGVAWTTNLRADAISNVCISETHIAVTADVPGYEESRTLLLDPRSGRLLE